MVMDGARTPEERKQSEQQKIAEFLTKPIALNSLNADWSIRDSVLRDIPAPQIMHTPQALGAIISDVRNLIKVLSNDVIDGIDECCETYGCPNNFAVLANNRDTLGMIDYPKPSGSDDLHITIREGIVDLNRLEAMDNELIYSAALLNKMHHVTFKENWVEHPDSMAESLLLLTLEVQSIKDVLKTLKQHYAPQNEKPNVLSVITKLGHLSQEIEAFVFEDLSISTLPDSTLDIHETLADKLKNNRNRPLGQ